MIAREEIEAWVREALSCTDKEYQVVELVRTAIELTAEKCAEIVEAATIPGHNVQAPSCAAIATKIREAVGYKLVMGASPKSEKRV